MPFDELERRVADLRREGWAVDIGEPQSDVSLRRIEAALECSLRGTYRDFVLRFGHAFVTDDLVCGVVGSDPLADEPGNVVYETLRARAELGVPDGLIVIGRSHDDHGFAICLDLRNDGGVEPPVVRWDPSARGTVHWCDSFEKFLLEHRLA